jgi:hypothetical protein
MTRSITLWTLCIKLGGLLLPDDENSIIGAISADFH